MTIVFALRARDGIVVAADGLTTTERRDPDSDEVQVQCETARKLVRVPRQKIAVLLTGRAAFGLGDQKRDVHRICTKFLATEFGPRSGGTTEDVSVELVARVVKAKLQDLSAREKGSGITALVAGYSFGNDTAEIWRLLVPSAAPPARDDWFETDSSCFERDNNPAGQLIRDELTSEFGRHLRNVSSEALIRCLRRILPDLADNPGRSNEFATIGGRWQILRLSPSGPPGRIRKVDPRTWILASR